MNQRTTVLAAVCLCLALRAVALAEDKRASTPKKAEIKDHHGVPTLFVDGQPEVFMGFCSYFPKEKYYRDFAAGGGHSFIATVSLSGRWVAGHYEDGLPDYGIPIWQGPGQYDFTTIDRKVKEILNGDPAAWIIIRVYVDSPRWWDKKYPEETCLWASGKRFRQSVASQLFRQQTGQTLRRIIEHVSACEWAGHVIGYFITGQGTEEWYYHGGPDYSAPMSSAFQRHLKNKYETVDALNRSWNERYDSFSGIPIPAPEELRKKAEHFTFRSLKREMKVIDYYHFASKVMAETVCHLAGIVKGATNHDLLCGTFYGYAGRAAPPRMGTCAIEDILKCPDIDFVTTPTCYVESRRIGTPWPSQGIVDSTMLAGKLWVNESDIRTHLSRNFYTVPEFCGPDHPRYGKQVTVFDGYPTEQEAVTALRKSFCWALSKGVDLYWFDLVTGYYDAPVYQDEFSRFRAILRQSLSLDRVSAAEVAVIVDPFAGVYMDSASNYLLRQTVETQRVLLSQAGAPFDELFTFDLERIDVDKYKIVFFLSTWKLDQKERELIQKRFKNSGRTLVWVYAAGAYDGEKDFSAESISDVTGIAVKTENVEAVSRISVFGRDHNLTRYLPGGTTFGTEFPCGPIVYSVDGKAEVLGQLTYRGLASTSTRRGRAGWVVKEFADWKSVHFSTPGIPSIILRRLMKDAGVHIYDHSDDILYANKNFVSVFSHEEGVREIRLPATCNVSEVFSGSKIGTKISAFRDRFSEGEQKLYQLTNEEAR